MTISVRPTFRSDTDATIGLPTRQLSGEGISAAVASTVSAAHSSVKRTLYCYAQELLAGRLRDVVEMQEAADRVAAEHGYRLGPFFIEEGGSSQAMHALVEAAAAFHNGGAAVAVPSRGHFIPLGRPLEWQLLLERVTGHPLVFVGRT